MKKGFPTKSRRKKRKALSQTKEMRRWWRDILLTDFGIGLKRVSQAARRAAEILVDHGVKTGLIVAHKDDKL